MFETASLGLAAGFVVALLATPVGVSGAVFLLPVQLSLLDVPSPAVTPTNLLYNVVSGPGALWRYGLNRALVRPPTKTLLLGTVPGVAVGTAIRLYAVPGLTVFRLVAAAVLLPLGVWLCVQAADHKQRPFRRQPVSTTVIALGFAVGVVGGMYGIGGGSLIGPILVAWGMPIALVAPAALTTTLATSVMGLVSYLLLSTTTSTAIDPVWTVGICAGLGGLVGSYLGAWLQPQLPRRGLTLLLGGLAMAIGLVYLAQTLG